MLLRWITPKFVTSCGAHLRNTATCEDVEAVVNSLQRNVGKIW